jgi:transketolase
MSDRDQICINTLRMLAVDMVDHADSGHPGLPLGAAPMAYVLWDRFLRHDPRDPSWPDRDRFILSAGHGSALLYSLLHLTGYDLPLEELRRFRQWGSKTPGHPENRHTPGVEATTGPLGQGFAMGVGMAMAEAYLARLVNRPGFPVVAHRTYGIVSDGDLMEGISSEAASLAGRLALGRLIYLYDDNHITIEGSTDLTFSENVPARFDAYGWQTLRVTDGNDLEAIDQAIRQALADDTHPSLILVRSHIGYGSPRQDSASAHGEPLGAEATGATKLKLGWPLSPTFLLPDEARAHLGAAVARGAAAHAQWESVVEAFSSVHPEPAALYQRILMGELPAGWDEGLPVFTGKPVATREASGRTLNALAARLPELIGGSADLAPSTKTLIENEAAFDPMQQAGRNIHFGIREHAMGGCLNGMALHGGLVPFGATFLIFSDYMRPSVRLAAMMQTHAIFVFTHDSIGLGEDGPTHQPVEHLMALRAIPGLTVIRPADGNETAAAWRVAVAHRGPVALMLSRQKLPILDASPETITAGVSRGGYILAESKEVPPQVVLLGTGSEVHLLLEAQSGLLRAGVAARVVSLPSFELFDAQPEDYRRAVLPPDLPRLAVEAGVTRGWHEYVGDGGAVIGLDRFGASAPGETVLRELGFTAERVVERALRLLGR